MNTIYDGSFLLGQTSATNFEAGPGITITEPTAGTLRISNDETTLFSNSAGVAGGSFPVNVSEPFSAFETIKFEWDVWNEGDYRRVLSEVKPVDNKFVLNSFYWNTSNGSVFYFAYPFVLTDLSLAFAADGKYKNLGTTATTANAGRNAMKMYGITGVNRKEV